MEIKIFLLLLATLCLSCGEESAVDMVGLEMTEIEDLTSQDDGSEREGVLQLSVDSQAVVQSVMVSGSEDDYRFNVSLLSPDTGCEQYADWWEVLTPDSTLVYRRILTHSHVNEQPFARSGGPIGIKQDEQVIIRGHMNNFGYGSFAMTGSVSEGFTRDTLPSTYATRLESARPLPDGCAF
jgi:hypothetical protein